MTIDETKLAQEIKNVVAVVHANEKFPVPVLAVKAAKAAQENPHDASLVTASNVLRKMASDNRMFISRQELNKLYDQLHSPNTKLAEVFAEELDRNPLPTPKVFQRSSFENEDLSRDYQKIGDPLLLNALEAAFSDSKEAKLYSNATAVSAEKSCVAELSAQGLPPKKVSIFAGQSDVIVCQASYDTPKGESHVLVPVEIKDGHALLPTMFLSQAGFMDLERSKLENHIASTGGKSYKIDGQKLLEVLAVAKNGAIETVDEVELAAIQVRAQRETPHTTNGILYQQIDSPEADVAIPEMPKTAEHEAFAKRLASPKGVAQHVFGERVVAAGENMLRRKMATFGFSHPQIAVSAVDENTLLYSVAVDHSAAFKVPVKVQKFDGLGLQVMEPTVAIASGNMSDFSRDGIVELLRTSQVDSRAIAETSPMYGMKPSDLMAQVREGIAEGNLLKAEDAIDVLGEVDPEAQKRAMALMFDSFNSDNLKKVASEHKGCAMVVQSSASKYPLCGHLNLPLHKVYQDQNGDCQPLYRRGVEETNEGGIFVTHRMLHY
jgi:hypothetical protein